MTLNDWLSWQETQHAKKIDLGLERTRPVLERLGLHRPPHAIITVAGTNGKGSSVAFMESMLRCAGYRVGAFSSPHLLRYNERIRVNGNEASDAELCAAFERIEEARGAVTLTYFEFSALAAFAIFQRAQVDVAILEVGMGGRLDTTNLLDADVALVTTVDIDHIEWLGPDRESIGLEKAGIFRQLRPAVCGDPQPPHTLLAHAQELSVPLHCLGRDYDFTGAADSWSWWAKVKGEIRHREGLPYPGLPGAFQLRNAAGALMALELLTQRLPLTPTAIHAGLSSVQLNGRFQIIPGAVTCIFDVAHNPHGAAALAAALREHPVVQARTLAVFAMLGDKDIAGVLQIMRPMVDEWFVGSLDTARGVSAEYLAEKLNALQPGRLRIQVYTRVSEACQAALAAAQSGDRILVFGSFHTVAEAQLVML